MRELTDKQKAALLHWTDPELRRYPTYETVAKRAGLSGKDMALKTLSALHRWGYLDADLRPTREGRELINRLKKEAARAGVRTTSP